MRKLSIATAAAALIAAAFPAAASETSASRARAGDATGQRVNEQAPERRVCVAVEMTGSHVIRRVCRTAREWEERGGLEPAQ